MKSVRLVFNVIQPFFLLSGVLTFALGSGIAQYFSAGLNWQAYLTGQAWVIVLQIGGGFLLAYASPRPSQASSRTGEDEHKIFLVGFVTAFTGLAVLTVLMIIQGYMSPELVVVLLLAALGSVLYALPLFRLETSGYGELFTSFLVAFLIPAAAFVLQEADLHRLIPLTCFPLFTSHLALLLAREIADYAADLRIGKPTLVVRLDWQMAMFFHNLLVAVTFGYIGMAMFFGLPRFLWLPAVLALPVGLFQLWLMQHIAGGGKPNWRLLRFTAATLFGLLAYLFALAYWTH